MDPATAVPHADSRPWPCLAAEAPFPSRQPLDPASPRLAAECHPHRHRLTLAMGLCPGETRYFLVSASSWMSQLSSQEWTWPSPIRHREPGTADHRPA